MNNDTEKDLENRLNGLLKSLPDRRAPRTLEHRVLAAIAARGALPWYHKSWAHWPLLARIAFILLSLAITGIIAFTSFASTSPIGTLAATVREDVETKAAPTVSLLQTLAGAFATLGNAIPDTWLYGGAALIAIAYVGFFSLGATAYRTLIANR